MSATDGLELPHGWRLATVGSVLADIQPGFASGAHNSDGAGLEHFRPMNVSTSGTINRTVIKSIDPGLAERPERRLVRGDILFNNTNSVELVGKTAYFDDDDSPAFSNHMTRLRTRSEMAIPEYLARYLHACWVRGDFTQIANNHVSQASVGRKVLSELSLPLPPVDVQKLIVQRLDQISQSKESVARHLACALATLSDFRHAVLASASSGRLTEDWREQQGAPEWRTAVARDVCLKVQNGGTPKTGFTDVPGIPFLKVYNIVDQGVNFRYRPQFVPEEVHRGGSKKSIAYPGDVIMNIVGPPLGKVAIIPDDYPEWNLNQAITIFRPGPAVLGKWLYIYLCSGVFMESDGLVTRGSAGQSNISLTQCRNLEIPLPSIDEQSEITRRVDQLMNSCGAIMTKIRSVSHLLEQTSRAVLIEAFSGDLIGTVA